MSGDRDEDLICAVSTPPGVGGISVIRLSGRGAFASLRPYCPFLPASPESHRVYHGVFLNPAETRPIDEVVVACFARGRSFTGEETAEISCHGNPLICADIVARLVEAGARPADRGEFTYRAFMNGRIDLVQAESVLSLIESRSSAAARLALRQLQGELSRRLQSVEDDLTWALAHIEAGIDFSTEGIDVVDPAVLNARLEKIRSELGDLVDSFRTGRVLKDGLRVALVGRPNVGKSSLLNNLLEEDRAIVTEIPGTTRDVLEGETQLEGRRFVFLDTAGIREASDQVERLGIARGRKALEEADLVGLVIDAAEGLRPEDIELAKEIPADRGFLVVNKVDIASGAAVRDLAGTLKNGNFFKGNSPISLELMFFVSALDRTTRTRILEGLKTRFEAEKAETSAVLSSARHYENLSRAMRNVEATLGALRRGVGSEFIAVELKEALVALQETLGKRFDDQIMDRVFKEFCIGK